MYVMEMDVAFYTDLASYYLVNMLPGILVAVVLYLLLRLRRQRRLAARGLSSSPLREAAMVLCWMFCGGMAILLLTPTGFHWVALLRYGFFSDSGTFFSLGDFHLVPFEDLNFQNRYTFFNLLGNIVMFLPFGFFAALLWRGFSWRRALGAGLGITLSVECWQLIVGRTFDVDDLLLNTLGVLWGYWLWLLLRRLAPQFTRRFHCRKAVFQ